MEAPEVVSAGEGPGGITTPDQRLRVFLSAVPGELDAELTAAQGAVEQLRLTPVLAESGAQAYPARDVYRAYVDQSDVFVGIYWRRYGRAAAGMDVSALEEQFRLSEGMPRLLYLKRPAPGMDPALRQLLDGIRAGGCVAYTSFADATELRELLLTDLMTALTEGFERVRAPGPGNPVPAPATELVGRDQDVAEVVKLLDDQDRRLVVLTGAGGIGKTRLALAVLERSRGRWRDGEAFVDLSPVADPGSVAERVALALGLVVQGRERPADTLARRLSGRRMLLVLDNFEQVVDAAPVVADLVGRAPRLHVLVTSRVVLRLRGEKEFRVEPLRVAAAQDGPGAHAGPGDGGLADGVLPDGGLAVLAEVPAVRLFLDRVRDVRPGFELTEENAAAVAELCRRLDGLPLALELAAAQMRLLAPAQMLARLEERLGRPGVLVDLPDRQQTLTATIEWSYDLLPASAQLLLTQLSAFAAPFTAEAAEAICGGADASAVEGLSVLLDHSMVSPAARADGAAGFRLLDAIRRFAAARLDNPDETFGRLERYLLGVLTEAAAQHGSQAWALRTLDSEQMSLQSVLAWLVRRQRPAGPMVRAVGDVWVWLLVRGHLRQNSEIWQRIKVLQEHGLRTERDWTAWYWLAGIDLLNDGSFGQAGELLEAALPDVRRLEKPARTGLVLMDRALARPYRAHSPARAELAEALEIAGDAGDPLVLGYVRSHYGLFLCVDGDPAGARPLHEQVLQAARSLGDDNQRAEAHYDLAIDALADGAGDRAEPHLAVAARHYRDIDHLDGMTRCLGALSAVALERRDPRLAAWLIGATAAARDIVGLTPRPLVAEVERRVTGRVQESLPDAEFTAQLAAGRTHPLDDALARALLELCGRTPAATW